MFAIATLTAPTHAAVGLALLMPANAFAGAAG